MQAVNVTAPRASGRLLLFTVSPHRVARFSRLFHGNQMEAAIRAYFSAL